MDWGSDWCLAITSSKLVKNWSTVCLLKALECARLVASRILIESDGCQTTSLPLLSPSIPIYCRQGHYCGLHTCMQVCKIQQERSQNKCQCQQWWCILPADFPALHWKLNDIWYTLLARMGKFHLQQLLMDLFHSNILPEFDSQSESPWHCFWLFCCAALLLLLPWAVHLVDSGPCLFPSQNSCPFFHLKRKKGLNTDRWQFKEKTNIKCLSKVLSCSDPSL